MGFIGLTLSGGGLHNLIMKRSPCNYEKKGKINEFDLSCLIISATKNI
jgi:hypothetical protein